MLVLSRKEEERIKIGADITITVLKIRGNTVSIGVEAPRHIPVFRPEQHAPQENATQENEGHVEGP